MKFGISYVSSIKFLDAPVLPKGGQPVAKIFFRELFGDS